MWGWALGSPTTACRITNSKFYLQCNTSSVRTQRILNTSSHLLFATIICCRERTETHYDPRPSLLTYQYHTFLFAPKNAVTGHKYCATHTIYFAEDKRSSWHHRTDLTVCVSYTCFPLVLPSDGNKEGKVVALCLSKDETSNSSNYEDILRNLMSFVTDNVPCWFMFVFRCQMGEYTDKRPNMILGALEGHRVG